MSHQHDFKKNYREPALLLGLIAGTAVFLGAWHYCVSVYGYFWGLSLGWIPSIFVAAIAAPVVGFLWPLAAIGLFLVLLPWYLAMLLATMSILAIGWRGSPSTTPSNTCQIITYARID